MGESVLLLRLEGPMQSWGTRSRWDVRDTGLEPTKSGMIGLIGCAMGLSRNDLQLEKLDQDMLFGVRIDRPGVVAVDFHTVTGYHRTAAGEFKHSGGTAKSLAKAREHDESTIVSPRDYLHDASFLVALVVKPEHRASNLDLLECLAWHLQHPKWPVYLGRKSCVPSRPIFDDLIEYNDLEDALRRASWMPRHRRDETPEVLEAWIECADGDYERQDALRLNQLRFYDFRRCRRVQPGIDAKQLPRRTA
ncbi:MAG: type I-E CRISPR-associated protein Cas5/CasD [Armatimonadota bacterium]